MKYLIHDTNSLGYDFRDFEAVLAFADVHREDSFVIYTRATNVNLFSETLHGERVTYVGYPKGTFSLEKVHQLAVEMGVPPDGVLAFSKLHGVVRDRRRPVSGLLGSSCIPYLKTSPEVIDSCMTRLVDLADQQRPLETVFGVVSGVKPMSDVGDDPHSRLEEGGRQTYPLDAIADVACHLQHAIHPRGLAFVPLCVQYGPRTEVAAALAEANRGKPLRVPLHILEEVDWDSRPDQQAACYAAIKRYSAERGVRAVAFGNASTYLHLILAATGGFGAMAVALHGYEVSHPRDGRAYWKELASELPFLRTFRQDVPSVWEPVSVAIQQYIKDAILNGS